MNSQISNRFLVLRQTTQMQKGVRPLHRKRQAGSTLVEFALTFILLMMVIFGICGFGHALYVYHFLSNTAREATRFAAVHGSTCMDDLSCSTTGGPATSKNTVIQDYVTSVLPPGIQSANLTTTPSYPIVSGGPTACSSTENGQGCTVQVQLSYTYNFFFPLLPQSSFKMTSTSEMVISH